MTVKSKLQTVLSFFYPPFFMLLHAPKNYLFMNKSVNFGHMKLKLGQSLFLRVVVRIICLTKKTER